jgi:KaiC/GvpD/RAD55 family RecA-like ATPase/HSP20 family molecular chaperone IbpA
MTYKAISCGLTKRILVPQADVISKLGELYEADSKKDYYISVFNYNQGHYDTFKKTNTLSGIKDVTTNTVIFDFDSKSDINKAKEDALTLFGRLTQKGIKPDDINVYFSGNKGMHIELNTQTEMSREEADNIRTSLAGDLTTSDSSVKDEQRIIRAPLSLNVKSNLFKIPLTKEELVNLTVDEIKKEASSISDFRAELATDYYNKRIQLPQAVQALKVKAKVEKEVKVSTEERLDFSRNKTGLTNAKYALSHGFFEEGERHEAVMILAATYLGLGWDQQIAYNSIKATLRLRASRLGLDDVSEETRQEVWKEVASVFSENWKGGMYSEDKNELLIKTKQRYNIEDKYDKNLLIKLSQVNSIFADFATNIDKNTLKLGIPSFDQEIRVTTSTLVSILAAPSAGKTSISFGILNSTSRAGVKSMFFSLDMAAPQVYQRLAQRHTGYHSDRLFKAYQTRDMGVIEKVEKTLDEEYSNVKFCFRGAMNVDIIREALLKEKELTGEFPKVIVVDYLENVLTDLSNDPTISKGFVARSLKDMANEFAICVILLTQPAKVSGGPSEELNSYYAIKGSGLVAEASATVITMHRPGFDPKNPADDNFITLTVVKNRMGTLGTFDYHWEGVRGTIRELLDEEKQTLKVVRDQNFAKKKGMDDL